MDLMDALDRCFPMSIWRIGLPRGHPLRSFRQMPLCHAFQRNAAALGRVFVPPYHPAYARTASTDMGNVSHYVPAIHPNLAAAPADCVMHNAEFARWAGSEMAQAPRLIDAKKSLRVFPIAHLPLRAPPNVSNQLRMGFLR